MLGLFAGLLSEGVFATIGCLNLVLLQFLGSADDRVRRSFYGLGLNAVAIGLGTLVGTAGFFAIPLVAIALIVAHLAGRLPRSGNLTLIVSVMFVLGVGLPGSSGAEAGNRALLVLLGGGLAVGGLLVHLGALRWLGRPSPDDVVHGAPTITATPDTTTVGEWPLAVAVGLTAAGGLALALSLGLARDYWIMLTVVVVLRGRFQETLSTAAGRMAGTFLGAIVGAVVCGEVTNLPAESVLLLIFAFGLFALQRVNYTLYALSLTAFIIVLLNLVYPAGLVLAETRVLDTVIGGTLALAAGVVLYSLRYTPLVSRRARVGG